MLRIAVRGDRVCAFRDDTLIAACPTRVTDPADTWVGLSMASQGNTECRWLVFTARTFCERE